MTKNERVELKSADEVSLQRDIPSHTVREYFSSLDPWDQEPRIDRWLMDYAAAKLKG